MISSKLIEKIKEGEPSDLIWQEAISLSESIGIEYQTVLSITLDALNHAHHPDTIAALSTCLIEHLLESDFSGFAVIETEIRSGNDKLLYALSICSKFGLSKAEDNGARRDSLVSEFRGRLSNFRVHFCDSKE